MTADPSVQNKRFAFVDAVQFLTRIPVRVARPARLAAAVPWFPVVGALIGAVVGGVAAALGELGPPTVAAAVGVVVGMIITGAFHEDGLADSADALAGGTTPEERVAILKDPRHGTYGVAALCGSIVLRIIALAALLAIGQAAAFAGAVSAHSLGRGAAVAVMGAAPEARTDGLGAEYVRSVGTGRAVVGALVAVAITALLTGWWVAPLAATAAIGAVAVAVLAHRAFGSLTGDHLGAIEQVVECAVLVVASLLAAHDTLWW